MAITRGGESSSSNGNLETKIELLFSQLDHLRELVFQRMDAEKEEREKIALENERRLEELNQSRADAREKFNDYVDKRLFTSQHEELVKKIELANAQLIGMSTIPSDLRVLFTWREEVSKIFTKYDVTQTQIGINTSAIKSLLDFKDDMREWRSRVVGIAIGAGAVCGALSGLLTHWLLK